MTGLILSLLAIAGQSRIVVNEVMANPKGSNSHAHFPEDRNEFIELYNRSDDTIDLRGWRLTDFDDDDTLCAWTDTLIRINCPHVRMQTTLMLPHSYSLIMDPEYTDTAPQGGWVQPYRFSDRLLILTIGNTTIGNGLANTDPVMLWSRDSSDVTLFGTWDSAGPVDAGDGVSWERVSPESGDWDTTWLRCRASEGCTPGRVNSVSGFRNLTCEQLLCFPLSFTVGMAETVEVRVRNTGRIAAEDWSVCVFRDLDASGRRDAGEYLTGIKGLTLNPGADTLVRAAWLNPEHGIYRVVAQLDWPEDQDTSDNQASFLLNLGQAAQSFCLQSDRFGPNLATVPETLVIAYSLPDTKGRLLVKVYDLDGREKVVIWDGRPVVKDGLLVWNGTDENGRMLPTGLYLVACEYKTGKQVIFEKKLVVLARR